MLQVIVGKLSGDPIIVNNRKGKLNSIFNSGNLKPLGVIKIGTIVSGLSQIEIPVFDSSKVDSELPNEKVKFAWLKKFLSNDLIVTISGEPKQDILKELCRIDTGNRNLSAKDVPFLFSE